MEESCNMNTGSDECVANEIHTAGMHRICHERNDTYSSQLLEKQRNGEWGQLCGWLKIPIRKLQLKSGPTDSCSIVKVGRSRFTEQ